VVKAASEAMLFVPHLRSQLREYRHRVVSVPKMTILRSTKASLLTIIILWPKLFDQLCP